MISFHPILLKAAEFAPGIPDKTEFGNLLDLNKRKDNILITSKHDAQRAGPHLDIRIGNPEAGLMSWATKNSIPEISGSAIDLFQQPKHKYEYKDFSGTIDSGYGAGYVHPSKQYPILIDDLSENHLDFAVDLGSGLSRYKLIRSKKDNKTWHLINITPNPKLPPKLKYKTINEDQAKKLISLVGKTVESVQPKIDGALGMVVINKGKVEIFSHRISKVSGRAILHTERLFSGVPRVSNLDADLNDTILLAEIYAVKKEAGGKTRVLRPEEISGLLNSKFYKTIEDAEKNNIEFRFYVFDVVKQGKKDNNYLEWYNRPYKDRVKYIERVLKFLPASFHAPVEAKTPQSAQQLLETIQKHAHPLTREGIVLFPQTGIPYKYKLTSEQNYYIVGFEPGAGKYAGSGIGAILYSDSPNGKPIGKVGVGIPDSLRKDFYENPDEYIGRQVRIGYAEELSSGKLRNPVFKGLVD